MIIAQKEDDVLKLKIENYGSENLRVYLIDGQYVRDNVFIDFTEGGNSYRYDFVPQGEIWIGGVHVIEVPYVCLHEVTEITYALKGGLELTSDQDYSVAHNYANECESAARKAPNTVDKLLVEAFKEYEIALASEEQTIWQES